MMPDVVGDADSFATRIVQYRNYEAHCDEEGRFGNGSEHFRLSSKLRVVIDALILKRLGITNDELSAAMRGSYEYWFYASNETWPWDVHN